MQTLAVRHDSSRRFSVETLFEQTDCLNHDHALFFCESSTIFESTLVYTLFTNYQSFNQEADLLILKRVPSFSKPAVVVTSYRKTDGFPHFGISFAAEKAMRAVENVMINGMTDEEFIEEEYKFIDDLKNSDVYKEMKRLSKEIDLNPNLNNLKKERDEALEMYLSKETSAEDKQKYLSVYKEREKQISEDPLVIGYLDCYDRVRNILKIVEEKILLESRK